MIQVKWQTVLTVTEQSAMQATWQKLIRVSVVEKSEKGQLKKNVPTPMSLVQEKT